MGKILLGLLFGASRLRPYFAVSAIDQRCKGAALRGIDDDRPLRCALSVIGSAGRRAEDAAELILIRAGNDHVTRSARAARRYQCCRRTQVIEHQISPFC
ncbi:hypothetical protein BH09PSE3_BH09PSE3_23140 [soil metagenome]